MNIEHRTPNIELSIWHACGYHFKISDNKLILDNKFLIEGAQRHPHSMFKVRRSMFDVHFNQESTTLSQWEGHIDKVTKREKSHGR